MTSTLILPLIIGTAIAWLLWQTVFAKSACTEEEVWQRLCRQAAEEERERIDKAISERLAPVLVELAATKSQVAALQGGQGGTR